MYAINFNHLYYFYMIAKHGSITEASRQLHLKPQTISGQLTAFERQLDSPLFDRVGRRLLLSEKGQMIFSYAEEIFNLGDELKSVIKSNDPCHRPTLSVGIVDAIPKSIAFKLLSPALDRSESARLNCDEGEQRSLLAELAINNLDMILSDQPLPSGSSIRAYNHQIAESGITFFASPHIDICQARPFPQCLDQVPYLLQGKNASIRQRLTGWFDKHGIRPKIIAEFDDTALMKAFAGEGYGVFAAPSLIEDSIQSQYPLSIIGRTNEVKEQYFAISHERKVKHPAVVSIINSASQLV